MKRLLVVDMLNMYFRAYIVDPSLSTNGEPIGGIKGTLKILQKLVRETSPDEVVLCWDGAGGSQRRKLVNKNYKEGRKPVRLNRNIRNMSQEDEIKNKVWQQLRLVEVLNETPFVQLMFDGIEADDVISYVVQNSRYRGWQKIMVSSDKDFFQLLDDETVLYRPIQKEVLNKKSVTEKFGIHPNNMALARAVVGDKSDNLEGVKGIGLPTVAKRFPFLSEEKSYLVSDLVEYSENSPSSAKAYKNLIEEQSKVKQNYKLMQLYTPSISAQTAHKINNLIDEDERHFNKTLIRAMMLEDGFGEINWSDLFQVCNKISMEHRRA
tara:strand:+ start:2403 stop:3368 length:966 start_codon:yes stop_codon:yes gene_type:complete